MRHYQSTKKLDIYKLFKLIAKIKKVKRNLDNDLKTHIEQVKLNQENTDLDSSIWNEITKQIEFFRHQIKSLRQNLHNKNINNMKIGLPTKKDVKKFKKPTILIKPYFNILININQIKEKIENQTFNKILGDMEYNIQERIESNENQYWNFWNMNLEKEDICNILGLAGKSNSLKKIVFYGNNNFDQECAGYYCEILQKSKSIIGADLYLLNFSSEIKKNILSVINSNEILKYFLIEINAFKSKEEINGFAFNLGLHTNDHDSKYWEYDFVTDNDIKE